MTFCCCFFSLHLLGPEDINDSELYQWSVTLTAQMWPPIESRFLGLPQIVWWGILSGCIIVFVILVFLTFLFCWLLPRRRQKKLETVTRDTAGLSTASNTGVICKIFDEIYFNFYYFCA